MQAVKNVFEFSYSVCADEFEKYRIFLRYNFSFSVHDKIESHLRNCFWHANPVTSFYILT